MTEQFPASREPSVETLTPALIEDELHNGGGVVFMSLCEETIQRAEDTGCREQLTEQVNTVLLLCDVPLTEWARNIKGVFRTSNETQVLTHKDAQRVAAYTQLGEWLHELTWHDMNIGSDGHPQSDTVTIVLKLPQQRRLLLIGKGDCWLGKPSKSVEWRMEFRAAIQERWVYNVE